MNLSEIWLDRSSFYATTW
uniref:Uncharacterized protein n=1 Tax=Arundo donax TaxID=35708 RepID=A0A0A8Z8F7_ARUDO